jgi:hypothetical protein
MGAALYACLGALSAPASASQAYGSINNFDCVNDTGSVCHGFEIEIDDAHSTDITYTYDYNHYGVPQITQDNANPLHPKVFVRYKAAYQNGVWSAYTAIPSAPIPPTAGHQFTNPSVNFGGEHFGVGFYGNPTSVKYSWLKDDGAGNLTFAGAVYISTPTFNYVPPAPAVPAHVVAAVVLPQPPAPPALEFGPASWVKEIKTTAHKADKVAIEDLVGDDPGKPQPWANGEQPEVESEWSLLQTDFGAADGGKNNELDGAPEELPNNDEVVTRRYEFYKYIGPIDAETGEAVADTVAADGKHGVGKVSYADHIDPFTGEYVNVTVDLSKVVIVGDFTGAQMAGFDAGNKLGLIAHVQDGTINVPYVDRTLVINGAAPIHTTRTGNLPPGMTFNEVTGVLSGTPRNSGSFQFTIESTDAANADVKTTYTLNIAPSNVVQRYAISTSASPVAGGNTSGDGQYESGANVTVLATANAGYQFLNWTEGGVVVSTTASYTFPAAANRSLVANFTQVIDVSAQIAISRSGFRLNRATGRFVQTVVLTNTGAAISGPVSLVLDNLSANASLFNGSGVTSVFAPINSPYIDVTAGSLAAGASVSVTLEFTDPTRGAFTYTTRVLAGAGGR